MKHHTIAEAAQYTNSLLDNPWGNPKRSLEYHLHVAGNITQPLTQAKLEQLAAFLNEFNKTGGRKQLPPDLVPLLGKMPSRAIARMTQEREDCESMGHNTVETIRKRMGIPPFPGGVDPKLIPILGRAPDNLVAQWSTKLGHPIRRAGVQAQRVRLNIAPYAHMTGAKPFDPATIRELLPNGIISEMEGN